MEQCLSIQNGVLKKGLSLAHQDFIKSTLIQLLSYFSQIETFEDVQKKNDFIREKLRDPTFLEYLYVNDFRAEKCEPQNKLYGSFEHREVHRDLEEHLDSHLFRGLSPPGGRLGLLLLLPLRAAQKGHAELAHHDRDDAQAPACTGRTSRRSGTSSFRDF
jgi:hypothetical protein